VGAAPVDGAIGEGVVGGANVGGDVTPLGVAGTVAVTVTSGDVLTVMHPLRNPVSATAATIEQLAVRRFMAPM